MVQTLSARVYQLHSIWYLISKAQLIFQEMIIFPFSNHFQLFIETASFGQDDLKACGYVTVMNFGHSVAVKLNIF